ncbi:hypothetical protein MVES1_002348 [Malassezia vespertilionis]|uniref:Uncharacterized protein n=1 Tax=Malassezia vespertilionis TaxID=2020962 RepID=A0A2N1JB52_9BASI|nr:uncharacterized protein MVES1_002348 [Malassezia vespertilionis]PKI83790.1 hypothetical protein MVES_002215 [Malassezia vespertilionis]WFD06993.1 hypothetical protein MVES1_002348 [Malassezia vespertilionis]
MVGARSETIAQFSDLVDAHLPAIYVMYKETMSAQGEAPLSSSLALLDKETAPLVQAFEALPRAESSSSVWDEVAQTLVYAKVHEFVQQGNIENSADMFVRLDIALAMQRSGLAEATLPLTVLEDTLSEAPIATSIDLFSYAESRVAQLTENIMPSSGKGLVLLRMCNELLRRLSKQYKPHAAFSGRIRTLLSNTFPINERSGVNLKGDFDIDNVTVWDEEEEKDVAMEEETQEDTHKEDSNEKEQRLKQTHNDAQSPEALLASPHFYRLFWSLQYYFSHPSLLFSEEQDTTLCHSAACVMHLLPASDSTTPMQTFQASAQAVLSVLGMHSRNELKSTRASKRTHSAAQEISDAFYPKLLTGRPLLTYELNDGTFRRHILVQFMILFQFLLGFTEACRERNEEFTNKLFKFPFVLRGDDEHWVRTVWRQVQTQLRDSGRDGKRFLETILGMLRREGAWIQWKGAGAPPLEKEPFSVETLDAWAQAAGNSINVAQYPYLLGTPALGLLWSEGFQAKQPSEVQVTTEEGETQTRALDGLEALEFPAQGPSIISLHRAMLIEEQKAKQAHAALDGEAQADALVKSDAKKQRLAWRALRTATPRKLPLFASMHGIDNIGGLLDAMQCEERGQVYKAQVLEEPDEATERAARDQLAREEEEKEEMAAKARAEERAAKEHAEQETNPIEKSKGKDQKANDADENADGDDAAEAEEAGEEDGKANADADIEANAEVSAADIISTQADAASDSSPSEDTVQPHQESNAAHASELMVVESFQDTSTVYSSESSSPRVDPDATFMTAHDADATEANSS